MRLEKDHDEADQNSFRSIFSVWIQDREVKNFQPDRKRDSFLIWRPNSAFFSAPIPDRIPQIPKNRILEWDPRLLRQIRSLKNKLPQISETLRPGMPTPHLQRLKNISLRLRRKIPTAISPRQNCFHPEWDGTAPPRAFLLLEIERRRESHADQQSRRERMSGALHLPREAEIPNR